MNLAGKTAIVTGASSGIGRATALELARRGANLALAARRPDELASVATICHASGVRAVAVPTDVTDPQQCAALVDAATRELGPIDLLVSNAGFAIFDRIEDLDPAEARSMIETNYLGALHCVRAVLPQMIARRSGSIVINASICGIMGFAGMGAYCASKFALAGFAEALRDEVLAQGIRVSIVYPATTETAFFVKAERGKMPAANRLLLAIPPERVARALVRAARTGRYRIVVPLGASAYMKLKEMFPRTAHFLMREVSAVLLRKRA